MTTTTAAGELRPARRLRRRRRTRLERGDEPVLAAVPEDRVDDRGRRDPGDDLHLDAATRAPERIDLKDLAKHARPGLTATRLPRAGWCGRGRVLEREVGRQERVVVGERGGGRVLACGQRLAGLDEPASLAVRVGSVVAHHVHAAVRDLLAQRVDEVDSVQLHERPARARVGGGLDPHATAREQLDRPHRQHHPRQVAREALEPSALAGNEALGRLDGETRVAPAEEALAGLRPQASDALQALEEAAAEALLEVCLLGPDHRVEATVAREDPFGDEHVQVRVEVGAEGAEGLERDDGARNAARLHGRLGEQRPQRVPGRLGHLAVKPPLPLDQAAECFRHGEDDVAVRHVEQHVLGHPLREDGRALGLAGGAEVSRAAGEGEQVLVVAAGAADPGETADRPPAGQVGVDVAAHHVAQGAAAGLVAVGVRAPVVLPEVLQQAVEGGALGVAGAVERRRRLRAAGGGRARPHIPTPRGTGGWSRRAGPRGSAHRVGDHRALLGGLGGALGGGLHLGDRARRRPKLFAKWKEEKIDVLTYRKGAQSTWQRRFFEDVKGKVDGRRVEYCLAEREVTLSNGLRVREIRRLAEDGHQTSIITTNETLSALEIAHRMFSRWRQENFFRYMRHECALDHLCTNAVEPADPKRLVTSPQRAALQKKLQAARAARMKLLEHRVELAPGKTARVGKRIVGEEELDRMIAKREAEVAKLKAAVDGLPAKVPLDTVLAPEKIVQLERGRKVIVDAIKLTAYRAESTLARLIEPFYARHDDEARKFLKTIFRATADILPDKRRRTLTVRFHGLASPRASRALGELCDLVSESEVCYPGTRLQLRFEMLASKK